MQLGWDRPGVVRATLKVQELAALVAGARLAEPDPNERSLLVDREGTHARALRHRPVVSPKHL